VEFLPTNLRLKIFENFQSFLNDSDGYILVTFPNGLSNTKFRTGGTSRNEVKKSAEYVL